MDTHFSNRIFDTLHSSPAVTLAIAIAIVLLIFGYHKCVIGDQQSLNSTNNPIAVALIGPLGTGKTALMARLATNRFPSLPTYSSMAVTQGTVPGLQPESGCGRPVSFIDCPGHPRLLASTTTVLSQHPSLVLVVMDATALHLNQREPIDYLARAIDSRKESQTVLVVLTKSESALPLHTLKSKLGSELFTFRLFQSVQLESTTLPQDEDAPASLFSTAEIWIRSWFQPAGYSLNLSSSKAIKQKSHPASSKMSLDELNVDVIQVCAKSGLGLDQLYACIRQL